MVEEENGPQDDFKGPEFQRSFSEPHCQVTEITNVEGVGTCDRNRTNTTTEVGKSSQKVSGDAVKRKNMSLGRRVRLIFMPWKWRRSRKRRRSRGSKKKESVCDAKPYSQSLDDLDKVEGNSGLTQLDTNGVSSNSESAIFAETSKSMTRVSAMGTSTVSSDCAHEVAQNEHSHRLSNSQSALTAVDTEVGCNTEEERSSLQDSKGMSLPTSRTPATSDSSDVTEPESEKEVIPNAPCSTPTTNTAGSVFPELSNCESNRSSFYDNVANGYTSDGDSSDTSSSDGEVLYRDDDEDDDDDEEVVDNVVTGLASKVKRSDSLALKLGSRPTPEELVDKNIIPTESQTEKLAKKEKVVSSITRSLSQRPTKEELEQRYILRDQDNEVQVKEQMSEKKRQLSRKLSRRPTVKELRKRKIINFTEYVEVFDVQEYDRRADKPWTRLTPKDKAAIRKELNEYKEFEMDVHEDSKVYTRFHKP